MMRRIDEAMAYYRIIVRVQPEWTLRQRCAGPA
jgi:hypothetical protein